MDSLVEDEGVVEHAEVAVQRVAEGGEELAGVDQKGQDGGRGWLGSKMRCSSCTKQSLVSVSDESFGRPKMATSFQSFGLKGKVRKKGLVEISDASGLPPTTVTFRPPSSSCSFRNRQEVDAKTNTSFAVNL
jgi:hypothetical protein